MRQLNSMDLDFCVSRIPEALRVLNENHPEKLFIAGGFVRSCITSEPINDIDVFVSSKEIAQDYAARLCTTNRHRLIHTDNAITVRGYAYPIQFIYRWVFDTVTECIASFDFTIACAAIWVQSESDSRLKWKSICDDDFYPDLAAKRLAYRSPVRNEDAGGSLLRVLKFYQRGYRIPLPSLSAVISRLLQGVRRVDDLDEDDLSQVLLGLLVEVDPDYAKSDITKNTEINLGEDHNHV